MRRVKLLPLLVFLAIVGVTVLAISAVRLQDEPLPVGAPTAGEETGPVPTGSEDGRDGLLPGAQSGQLPFTNGVDENLADRLAAIGLPALSEEGLVLHTHQHLTISINGQEVTVPANIGINEAERYIAPLHTHDTTGILHVESPEVKTFTLGQFFDVWGLNLTNDCIGAYCRDGENDFTVYSHGRAVTGDVRQLQLTSLQQITIVYGSPEEGPTEIPVRYNFPGGY